MVDTTHIIKRGIIRYPRDRTPPLERYKPRKGRLITGGRKPAPPAELITSNAVPPTIITPQPVRPIPNFTKVSTAARPIRPLPSRVRLTLHIETLKKQVNATHFRLQPLLGAYWERLDKDRRKQLQLISCELDKVCADLYTGTREYTFIEKQVVNTVCLELGRHMMEAPLVPPDHHYLGSNPGTPHHRLEDCRPQLPHSSPPTYLPHGHTTDTNMSVLRTPSDSPHLAKYPTIFANG
ncbi:uncharacterized protein LAESUDRAFT_765601 [Laetiporus sulphureus 93-53]|uniref:Uncharacterized protein n=1 Tax=Laetiporus sulphureus 93-53 TaxID=1314785 RepID=A0A165AP70_9APHY|nr:uncharacterized protein LAESUDRAFT_765601 [Laetiporus sulphureus 93-53]KZS99387.1 hypothetical protein LAESUDRAFT_765601 [Laetiporus sulphureus 93-53]